MSKQEKYFKKIFTQDTHLPEIVQLKKQEAYEQIRAKARSAAASDPHKSRRLSPFQASGRRFPRAAVVLIACVLLTGCTAIAASNLQTRRERLRALKTEDLKQFLSDGQITLSRDLSAGELKRYALLSTAYQYEKQFPESEITRLPEGTPYPGTGICLMPFDEKAKESFDPAPEYSYTSVLCLPDTELTDEELLEIIDYQNKSVYAHLDRRVAEHLEKNNWESRLAAMSDEEIDYYYLAAFCSKTDISDGFVRGDSGYDTLCLTASETERFETLEHKYKEENLFPEGSLPLIEQPKDYDGSKVVICRYDAMYYIPERELTDEEILEIIDFRAKSGYAIERINYELSIGYRTGYPKLTQD